MTLIWGPSDSRNSPVGTSLSFPGGVQSRLLGVPVLGSSELHTPSAQLLMGKWLGE